MSVHTPVQLSHRPLVERHTAPNPGPLTLQGTNSYRIGPYLIDPGPNDQAWIDTLADRLRSQNLEAVLLTHGHPDHAGAALPLAARLSLPLWAPSGLDIPSANHFSEGHTWPLNGAQLHALHTPGHAAHHMAFWLPDNGILVAGDTILGEGTALVAPPDGDMAAYLRTLDRLASLRPELILPGHGAVITTPAETISAYRQHRREREDALLMALPGTIPQLVARVYRDVPLAVFPYARGQVVAQLIKLRDEGRVSERGGVWVRTGGQHEQA